MVLFVVAFETIELYYNAHEEALWNEGTSKALSPDYVGREGPLVGLV